MTTEQQNLSIEQKELVAVGASVGAGCQPCVSHHLEAGARAGLDREQLLAAVTSAERVSAEAAVRIGDHARVKLGPDVTSPALLSRLEEALASLGAALGANEKTNIDRQLRAAAELGASLSQLQQAIETAHNVQANAARIHQREAERLLNAIASPTAAADDDGGCGCGADVTSEEVPEQSEEPELVARGTRRGGCAPMAAPFATAGTSAGMTAGCREMFERFQAAAGAETESGPTAAAAAAPCRKED